jgi:hypothetical protein
MFPGSDPLAPISSRFPLSPINGRIPMSGSAPSLARPFVLRFVTDAPIRKMAKHGKKETRTTKTRPTRVTGDGQEEGGTPDTETYVEITYE